MNKTNTKESILKILLEDRNNFHSGEKIATALGLSRAAISKNIKKLIDDGYSIEAITNRGYKILKDIDRLSSEEIKEYLKIENVEVEVFETIDSTNKYGKELLNSGFRGRKVIVANTQSAGRGRLGRKFYSPSNTGIYMTILDTELKDNVDNLNITIVAAIALREVLFSETGKDCKIKWVNDIYLDGKKVAGILSEGVTNLESGCIEGVVVGMGVNYTTEDFPEDIKNIAASLEGRKSRNKIIGEIVNKYFEKLEKNNEENLETYRNNLLYIGEEVNINYFDGKVQLAIVQGINEKGNLIVLTNEGLKTLVFGEISVKKSSLSS